MMMFWSVALLLGQVSGPLGRGPEPAARPVSWQFDLKYLAPRHIEYGGQTYWYMVYTVTNTSRETQYFFPTFQLVTEDLKVIDTDTGIPAAVFEEIKRRHGQVYRELMHPTSAIGDLPAGADNARESVAIWRSSDVHGPRFSIYAAGLSGEAQLRPNPAYDANKPEQSEVEMKLPDGQTIKQTVAVNPRYFTIRKTLELRFLIPTSGAPGSADPVLELAQWVMR